MKAKLKKYSIEIVKFVIVLSIIANIISYFKSTDLEKSDLQLDTVLLLDEVPYKIKSDKAVMIHFWATWCPICKIEASNINSVSKDYEVITIAVSSGDDDIVKEYLQKQDVDFKVINDFDGKLAQKFNISVYPTTLVYDKNKKLLFSDVGYTSTLSLKLKMWYANL